MFCSYIYTPQFYSPRACAAMCFGTARKLMYCCVQLSMFDFAEIVVGLERTFYNTTEGDVGVLSVCMALLNGTLNGASLFFSISTHDTPTDSATNGTSHNHLHAIVFVIPSL